MRILVTGASGFIGSHIVKTLLREGHTVGAFVHNPKRIWRIKKEVQKGHVDLHVGDITRKDNLKTTFKNGEYDVVINTVALLSHPNKNLLKQVNALGVKNILEVALEYSVESVVHTSVACIQGKKTIKSEYFKTKLMGEHYAKMFYHKGLNIAVIRPTPVYGPLDNKGLTLIILTAASGMTPVFPGSSEAKLKTIYVKDLANYYSKLVSTKIKGLEYHTICGKETVTLGELFKIVHRESGRQAPILLPNSQLKDTLVIFSEIISKALKIKNITVDKEILNLFWAGNHEVKCNPISNWEPKYTIKQGIAETIRWAKKNNLSSHTKLLSFMLKG